MHHVQFSGAGDAVKTSSERAANTADLKKACADFESVLAYYLFKSMRETVPDGGLFKKEDTFSMLMDQKLAEQISQKGEGLGLQNTLFRQLGGKP